MIMMLCLLMAGAGSSPSLKLDLSFGGSSNEDVYLWSDASSHISADAQGQIYIADSAENRVLVFDQKGVYLKTLAGPGAGPGEYEGLLRFRALDGGGFAGLDVVDSSLALDRFSKDGTYLDDHTQQLRLEMADISANGNFVTGFWVEINTAARQMSFKTGILDKDLKIVLTQSDAKGPIHDRSRFQEGGYWAEWIGRNLKRSETIGICHVSANGDFYTAKANQYTITRTQASGKSNQWSDTRKPSLRSPEELEAFTDSMTEGIRSDPMLGSLITKTVMAKAVELADLSPAKSSIYAITTTDDGTVVVIDDINLKTRMTHATLFDPSGKRLGEISLPDYGLGCVNSGIGSVRIFFRGAYAYTLLTSEDGELRAARYHWK